MPIYDYHCEECEHEFEFLVEGDAIVTCSHCESKKVNRQLNVIESLRSVRSSQTGGTSMLGVGCDLPQCGSGEVLDSGDTNPVSHKLRFEEHALSGARLTIPFTFLKRFGPRHHAVVIGLNQQDQKLWIAELSRRFGYRIVSLDEWLEDNSNYLDELVVTQNNGERANFEVGKSAAREIIERQQVGDNSKYQLIFNNCESFADRHSMGGNRLSPQVAKVLHSAGVAIVAGAVILTKHKRRSR